ncbi:MAG: hypothetical protein ACYDFU_02520 [Nitrospirota bacterium]
MALNNSFLGVLDALSAAIVADPDVTAFCQAQYGQNLTVKFGVRRIAHISDDEFPLVQITRTEQTPSPMPGMLAATKDELLIYTLIFNQNDDADVEPGFRDITQLTELIDQAIQRNMRLGGLVKQIMPGESGYDEGVNYPKFASVLKAQVRREINLLAR